MNEFDAEYENDELETEWVCPHCLLSDARQENGMMRCVCGVDTPLNNFW